MMIVLKILASLFEIMGAFLLAVEAMKVSNLGALAVKLGAASHILHPFTLVGTPKITALGWKVRVIANVLVILFGALFLVVGFTLFGKEIDWLPFRLWKPDDWIALPSIGVFISWFTGVLAVGLLLNGFGATVKFLNWTRLNTESGVVGITGFGCFLVSVLLKLITG